MDFLYDFCALFNSIKQPLEKGLEKFQIKIEGFMRAGKEFITALKNKRRFKDPSKLLKKGFLRLWHWPKNRYFSMCFLYN